MPLTPPNHTTRELAERFPRPDPPLGPDCRLYRIYRIIDPETGRLRRSPFYFSTLPRGRRLGYRYDLPAPNGACYFAGSALGAWLEVFREAGQVIALDDLRIRRLCNTRPLQVIPAANLIAPAARRFGVTGEIHTCDNYTLPRQWALALFDAGFRGLIGKIRHDPQLIETSVTLLDTAGSHQPYGWRWDVDVQRLDSCLSLLETVVEFGFRIVAVPYDVTTSEPRTDG